jgi:hypothetical protein
VALGDRKHPFMRESLSCKREIGKQLVLTAAAEVPVSLGFGRIRVRRIPSASLEYVQPFIREGASTRWRR